MSTSGHIDLSDVYDDCYRQLNAVRPASGAKAVPAGPEQFPLIATIGMTVLGHLIAIGVFESMRHGFQLLFSKRKPMQLSPEEIKQYESSAEPALRQGSLGAAPGPERVKEAEVAVTEILQSNGWQAPDAAQLAHQIVSSLKDKLWP